MLTKEQLRPILESRYNRNDWYRILRQNFNVKTLVANPASITSITGNEFDASAFILGELDTVDGYKVGIYEVDTPGVKQIHRNKVGLRNLLKNIYQTDVDAALIVFTQGELWRFSYVSELTTRNAETGRREIIKTDAKRYTYLFGKDEKAKTAAERFSHVHQEDIGLNKETTLKALQDTFSVEKMSKDFFSDYRKHYGKFLIYLIGENEDGKALGTASPLFKTIFNAEGKKARDFVKKMLGRIVFLYFLEKKGWLGVPEEKNWGKGDPDFLRNLFNDCKDKSAFYPLVLEPLFHNTLNTTRENDYFDIDNTLFSKQGYNKLKIPFLNGGLFEPEKYNTDYLVFPEELFESLFAFFDRYNFTVHEDSPDEHTVAVDPEMLGHIFENLLEDNKGKGAFYTPKAIVHYMCQESLIQYLYDKCDHSHDESLKEEFEKFIKNQSITGVSDYRKIILQALREVKICDPAIGSGAFPMGMLLEIFHALETLNYADPQNTQEVWELKNGWHAAQVKLDIIQNSIYGVDIEPGAVDIARLRFWLSLVVDEDKPQPLPNLDYKIMQGNSLLERFHSIELDKFGSADIDLKVYEPETDLFGRIKENQFKITFSQSDTLKTVQKIIKNYFNERVPANKARYQNEINKLVTNHIDYNLNLKINQLKRLISEIEDQNSPTKSSSRKLKEWKDELNRQDDTKSELRKAQDSNGRPYFLWHLFFKDIFDGGGFDIVIGNPPYIQLQSMKEQADLLEDAKFQTYERTGDVYALFYELGVKILKPDGILTFITSNKWMRAGYGVGLRNYFITETYPLLLVDCGGFKVFETATVDTNILMLKKSIYSGNTKTCILNRKLTSLNKMSVFIRQHTNAEKFNSVNSWTILSSIEKTIKNKIEALGTPLKDWDITINYGIKTGFNEAFIIDGDKRKQLIAADPKSEEIIRPILRGRDIKKYGYDFADLWLINVHNGVKEKRLKRIDINDYPAIKGHLDYFSKNIEKRTDQGDTPYNLRNCAYTEDFFKQKIIWKIIGNQMAFSIDSNNYIVNNACYILIGSGLEYLLSVLNSKTITWYSFITNMNKTGVGDVQVGGQNVNLFPIPLLSELEQKPFADLVEIIIKEKAQNKDTSVLEKKIQNLVNELYGFTKEEADFIESQ